MPTALLIIDVQQGLCTGAAAVHDAAGVISRINQLGTDAREAEVPVIVVQHEDDSELIHDSAPWQLAQGLRTGQGDLRLRKRGSDAFHHTDLHSLLKMRHISRLVICGMQTEFCVESTVRRALALGYAVTLVSDGHTTAGNAVLAAPQIIAHHNDTLRRLGAYGVRATPVAAAGVRF